MIRVELTKREFVEANRFLSIPHLRRGLLILSIYCTVCLVVLPHFLGGSYLDTAKGIGVAWILAAAALYASGRYFMGWRRSKAFESDYLLRAPFSVDCSEDAITFSSEFGSSTFPWKHWKKWRENTDFILLSATRRFFFIIPKRCFASAEGVSQFRNLLAAKIGPAS